jgi:hypothetical protein
MLRTLVASVALLVATTAFAEPSPDSVAGKLLRCAPKTYEQALNCLDKSLTAEDKAELAKPDGPFEQHMGLGMWIRNNWGLWKGGPLARDMYKRGFVMPDDMSAVILESYASQVRGEPFDLAAQAAKYRTYWDSLRKRTPLPKSDCVDKDTSLESVNSCERDGNGMIHVNDPVESH